MQTPAEVATAAAAETAAMRQSIADMSKTLTDLTTALGKRSGQQCSGAFGGPPGESSGFAPECKWYVPYPRYFHLASPPASGRHRPNWEAPLSLVVGPNGEAQFVSTAPIPGATALLREVPDILAFVEAWMVFMSVLQNEHLDLLVAQGLSAYLNNIITIARVLSHLLRCSPSHGVHGASSSCRARHCLKRHRGWCTHVTVWAETAFAFFHPRIGVALRCHFLRPTGSATSPNASEGERLDPPLVLRGGKSFNSPLTF
ncbi:hypothetical protein B0H14DRAFT_3473674 [Mycena olivaceomarginata]|nr:hypothetical protein B0H14DRAFT_3473674 [Mycena olivaceomarginata]